MRCVRSWGKLAKERGSSVTGEERTRRPWFLATMSLALLMSMLLSSAVGAQSSGVTNLGKAVTPSSVLDGNVVAFNVRESSQAFTDLNGDGDTNDAVLQVLNPASGAITNLGLAAFDGFQVEKKLVVLFVRESGQGNTDLNGDGDTFDTVPHVFDAATGMTTNLGLAATSDFRMDGHLVAFRVREFPQGSTDLNGDGDLGDEVLHVFNAATGSTTNLGLDVPVNDFQVDGQLVAFTVRESRQGRTDLNGDGDSSDEVLHVFDAATGNTTNVGLATPGLQLAGKQVAFAVREANQGLTDLNGDGDTSDQVLHVFHAGSGAITNLGLSVSLGFRLEGHLLVFTVFEVAQGSTDLNGDGDARDFVAHAVDTASGEITNLGLGISPSFPGDGKLIALSVREFSQGNTDLNGDGDTNDSVLHLFNAATGAVTNLGLAATGIGVDGKLVVFRVLESSQGGSDLNGDGDISDQVLHVANAATESLINLGLDAAFGNIAVDGHLVAFGVNEARQGNTDLNDDGDTSDLVLHLFNAATVTTTNVGVDASIGRIQAAGQQVLFRVRESSQGNTDLNGDGDTFDDVVHIHRPSSQD